MIALGPDGVALIWRAAEITAARGERLYNSTFRKLSFSSALISSLGRRRSPVVAHLERTVACGEIVAYRGGVPNAESGWRKRSRGRERTRPRTRDQYLQAARNGCLVQPLTACRDRHAAFHIAGFGQFADQRIMQATVDGFAPDILTTVAKRYDYSDKPQFVSDGAFWVDYVSDLGDGFDSTYSVASLIAADSLEIAGAGQLPAAKLLIMGGDQVYPFPTRASLSRAPRDALQAGPAGRREPRRPTAP